MPTSPLKLRRLVLIEMLLIVVLGAWLGMLYYNNQVDSARKDRDALRLVEIDTIQTALAQYATAHHSYPACLYATSGCTSLEGNGLSSIPTDPLSGMHYSYAAFGKGSVCTGYHIGLSLERKGSQSLLTGSDASTKPDNLLCAGSAKDFSGLSPAPGGQPCSAEVGIAQPTDSANGETCYDLERVRLPVKQ